MGQAWHGAFAEESLGMMKLVLCCMACGHVSVDGVQLCCISDR